MQQSGVIDRLQQKFVGDSNGETDAVEMQDINGLGYEKVAFPFLALLTGLCVAFMQLGFETAITCKKKWNSCHKKVSTSCLNTPRNATTEE